MDIRTKTTDYQMPQEVAAYLDERLAHVEKLLGADTSLVRCEVEIGRDSGHSKHGDNMWFAEISVSRPGFGMLRATNRSESVNGAIDDAKAELERQIRSEKQFHRRIVKRAGAFAKRLLRME
jgi:ribosomal subunit interface protein